MDRDRRRVVGVAGASLASAILAGCLSAPAPGTDGSGGDGTDDGTGTDGGDDSPRVDEPPYEITEPACDPPDGDRDPLWLCENMPAEPSLSFEQVETSNVVFADEGVRRSPDSNAPQFYATLLTDGGDVGRADPQGDSAAIDLIEATDFETQAVLAVQTGWGSGSITPHLERVEATESGIHGFGCYRRPCVWTDDYTRRTTVARFERPDTLESATVSLTVDPETRVTFDAAEGVVTVPSLSDS